MLDQSFSAENFYSILVYENRKGNNLEKKFLRYKIFERYSLKLKEINSKLRKRLRVFKKEDTKTRNYTISENLYKRYKRYLWFIKRKTTLDKEKALLESLQGISANVQKNNFKISLHPVTYRDKPVYVIDETPEAYFVMKQLQFNFYRLYKTKQSNRYAIVNHLRCILDDKFPKFIVRTDIKDFYESIPNKKILERLNTDNLLSPMSKKFIKQIIKAYELCSGAEKGVGIPRGIGISAYLAEYFMRKIDKEIRELEYVTYYARFVDDIVAIFTPKFEGEDMKYFQKIEDIISKQAELTLHKEPPKTQVYDLLKREESVHKLEYLGYHYEFYNNAIPTKIGAIKIALTQKRLKKNKNKIKSAFETYRFDIINDPNTAYRYLKNRMKFLTGNTRLVNNKNNILVGAFFSNSLLTNTEPLEALDRFMKWHISRYVKSPKHKEKLLEYSFVQGFKEKRYHSFTGRQLNKITSAWKTL
jgi:hypothetical protein